MLFLILVGAKQPQVSKAGYPITIDSQVSLRSRNERRKFVVILTANLLKGNNSCCLLVDDSTETSFSLDDDIRNTHLATEGRKEDHKLNRVNIMCNNDKGCLLCLNQSNDVIETIFRVNRLFCIL